MPKKHKKYHTEKDSPFFRMRSRKRLADLLHISKAQLQSLARDKNLYKDYQIPKSSGDGYRNISIPAYKLKIVQSRIKDLLHRISPPDYLFSPVGGRSYVENAAVHRGAKSIHQLDISNYYPNCTSKKVYWYFNNRMQCSSDVAAVLSAIATKDGVLPQGSPCSPILAFLSYIDMWEEIAQVVEDSDCALSVYVDDITISGDAVLEETSWKIRKALHKHGHELNSAKGRRTHLRPAEITGVIVRGETLHAPNRQHKILHAIRRDFATATSKLEREKLTSQIRGREAQIKQIDMKNSAGDSCD